MIWLIVFILAGIGLTSIIVDSEFFSSWKLDFAERTKVMEKEKGAEHGTVKKRRKIYYMLNCYQCSGFWVGLILGVFANPLACSWYFLPVTWLMCGCMISFASQIGMALFNYLNVQYGSE